MSQLNFLFPKSARLRLFWLVIGFVIGLTVALALPAFAGEPTSQDFLGAWEGSWNGNQSTELVVEKIEDNKAQVVYSWGPYRSNRPGEDKLTAEFQDHKTLVLRRSTGAVITYRLRADGKLDAEYVNSRGSVNHGTMTKKK